MLIFHESNKIDGFSISASILKLWYVLSLFSRPFRDIKKISTERIKTKPSNEILYCYLMHVFLVKGDMTMIPMNLLRNFFKILAYHVEIALHVNAQNPSIENFQTIQCSVHKSTRSGCPKKYSDVMNPIELIVFPS